MLSLLFNPSTVVTVWQISAKKARLATHLNSSGDSRRPVTSSFFAYFCKAPCLILSHKDISITEVFQKNIKTKFARVAWLKLQTWEILEEPLEVWNLLRKIGKSDEQSVCARGSSPDFSNKETLCTFSIASSESFSVKTDWIKETDTIVQGKL